MTEDINGSKSPRSNHICGVYRESEAQLKAVSNYLKEGLEDSQKCVVVGLNEWNNQVAAGLQSILPSFKDKFEQKQVQFFNAESVFLVEGSFSSERIFAWLEKLQQKAVTQNLKGLRILADMSWSAKYSALLEELCSFESNINEFIGDRAITCMCLYNPRTFQSKQLYRILLAHPYLVNENYNGVCPHYLPTDQLFEEQRKRFFSEAVMSSSDKQVVLVEQKQAHKDGSVDSRVVEGIKDPVLIINSSGEILYMNQDAQIRYGNQVNRICHDTIFKNITPCSICQIVKMMGKEKQRLETEVRDNKGSHLNVVAYPFNSAEFSKSIIISMRDITQRKKWEEESAFMDKFSSLGYLAGGIAHELNNNLTPIVVYSQMLCQPELAEDVRTKAKKIETCALASRKLVESLTDFSQKIPNKKDFSNLNDLVRKTIDLMENRLGSAGIKPVLNLDPNLPNILVDELKIQQVFSNLITNAYQAMKDTGGTLSINSFHSQGWCKFEISDTGPGVPEEIRDRIFDPFFTTREFGNGQGLGLSSSYGIVAAHQGRLYFNSADLEGATFVVELPVVASMYDNLKDAGIDASNVTETKVNDTSVIDTRVIESLLGQSQKQSH
ncbi:MAG: MEDS domain-containing protein [candidate division Zixibacteria bacterium]|nr:MEDS domain-containing protein [candidate division Zixibacteria bacterium]